MKNKDQKTKYAGMISLLVLATLLRFSGFSFASPVLMGRLTSVYPYGAQDVIRNPALIVFQRQDNTMGLLLDYQSNIDKSIHDINTDAIVGQHLDSKSGSGGLSYIRKNDIFALGFDVNASYGHARQSMQFYANRNTLNTLGQGTAITYSESALFSLSAGVMLDSSSSLGIQIFTGYSNSEMTSKRNTYLSPPFPPFFDDVREFDRTIQEQVTISPAIGYLVKIEKSEIGLMFTAGRFVWEKNRARELRFDTMLLGPRVSANGELPFYARYDISPGLIAGSFSKLCDFINAGMELQITFPLGYKTQFLEPLGDLYPFTFFVKNSKLKLENKISNRPFLALRGGFEFIASPNIVFSLGGGIGLINIKSRTRGGIVTPTLRDDQLYQKIMSLYGTAGVDFIVGMRHTITVGAVLSHSTFSIEDKRYQQTAKNDPIAHWANSKIKSLTIDMIIALSFGF